MKRDEILHKAEQVICNDRKDVYGEAENCFEDIANLWAMYLGECVPINKTDAACMMILLKIARAKSNPLHMDNWIDICGYAAIGAELAQKEYRSATKEEKE